MTSTRTTSRSHRYPPGWLVGHLPVGMQDDDLFVRFATIFERVASTLREGADNVDHVADPAVAPPEMLALMGRWLGYDLLETELVDRDLSTADRRRILRALGLALPMRGTAEGLRRILEAVTDDAVVVEDPGGTARDPRPLVRDPERTVDDPDDLPAPNGRLVVRVASTGHLREHELRALVRDEAPAHVAVDLVLDTDLAEPA